MKGAGHSLIMEVNRRYHYLVGLWFEPFPTWEHLLTFSQPSGGGEAVWNTAASHDGNMSIPARQYL